MPNIDPLILQREANLIMPELQDLEFPKFKENTEQIVYKPRKKNENIDWDAVDAAGKLYNDLSVDEKRIFLSRIRRAKREAKDRANV